MKVLVQWRVCEVWQSQVVGRLQQLLLHCIIVCTVSVHTTCTQGSMPSTWRLVQSRTSTCRVQPVATSILMLLLLSLVPEALNCYSATTVSDTHSEELCTSELFLCINACMLNVHVC